MADDITRQTDHHATVRVTRHGTAGLRPRPGRCPAPRLRPCVSGTGATLCGGYRGDDGGTVRCAYLRSLRRAAEDAVCAAGGWRGRVRRRQRPASRILDLVAEVGGDVA